MSQLKINSKRNKVSPGGVVTLPVSARKTLQMMKGEGAHVSIAATENAVSIIPAGKAGGIRVSAKGQLELRGELRAILERGGNRHFWLELDDSKQLVLLHPVV